MAKGLQAGPHRYGRRSGTISTSRDRVRECWIRASCATFHAQNTLMTRKNWQHRADVEDAPDAFGQRASKQAAQRARTGNLTEPPLGRPRVTRSLRNQPEPGPSIGPKPEM